MNITRNGMPKSPAQIAAEARFFQAIVSGAQPMDVTIRSAAASTQKRSVIKHWVGYYALKNLAVRPSVKGA